MQIQESLLVETHLIGWTHMDISFCDFNASILAKSSSQTQYSIGREKTRKKKTKLQTAIYTKLIKLLYLNQNNFGHWNCRENTEN